MTSADAPRVGGSSRVLRGLGAASAGVLLYWGLADGLAHSAPLAAQRVAGLRDRVVSVRIRLRDPVVVTARYSGFSRFRVYVLQRGTRTLVFDELGSFQGQALVVDATPGRWRVHVDTVGAWTLRFTQSLQPTREIPGELRGAGSRVFAVGVRREVAVSVRATHRGREPFDVRIVGYRDSRGFSRRLFAGGVVVRGRTRIRALPVGTYYVAVTADGSWALRFSSLAS